MSHSQVLLLDAGDGQLAKALPALQSLAGADALLLTRQPEAALELLTHRELAVVLADFGDRITDCAGFFKKARILASTAIRIAVAGNVHDFTEGLRAGGLHYCVSSRSDAREIHAVLERCRAVWQQVQRRPNLAAMLARLESIPTPPAVYFDLRDALQREASNYRTLVELVQRDQALAAKILRLANSGFYGKSSEVADLSAAFAMLGTEMVLALALTSHLLNCMPLPGIQLDGIWKHAVAVSTAARFIAREEGGDHATIEASGVAGLLHDIGGLLLLANYPSDYQQILRQSMGDESKMIELENMRFGVAHPELGYLILALWNLPERICRAVQRHHASVQGDEVHADLVADAVHTAELLLHEMYRGPGTQPSSSPTDRHMGWDPSRLDGWRIAFPELIEKCCSEV